MMKKMGIEQDVLDTPSPRAASDVTCQRRGTQCLIMLDRRCLCRSVQRMPLNGCGVQFMRFQFNGGFFFQSSPAVLMPVGLSYEVIYYFPFPASCV